MQIDHFIISHQLRCKHVGEELKSEMELYIGSINRYTVLEKKAIETISEYDLEMEEKNTHTRIKTSSARMKKTESQRVIAKQKSVATN